MSPGGQAEAAADEGSDKAGQWNDWYDEAIALAEDRYEIYLKERAMEEGGAR